MARKHHKPRTEARRRTSAVWLAGACAVLAASVLGGVYATGGFSAETSPAAHSAMTPQTAAAHMEDASLTGLVASRKVTAAAATDVTITGSSNTLFYPGTTVSVDVTFHNPAATAVTVKNMKAVVEATTSNAGCSGPTNYGLANPDTSGGTTLTFPSTLVIPANSSKSLSDLGVPTADWPQITMFNLPVNQDACSGAHFTVDYSTTTGAPLTPPSAGLRIVVTPKLQTLKVTTHKKAGTRVVTVSFPKARFKIKVTNTSSSSLRVKVGDKLASKCGRTFTLAAHKSRTYSCLNPKVKTGFKNIVVATGTTGAGSRVVRRANARVKLLTSTGVTVTKNNAGTIVTLSIPDVLFAFNKSTLGPGAQRALATVLAILKANYPTGHLTVTGYTDSIGSAAYNLELSKRRSTAVALWLVHRGIPAGRVTIAFKGEGNPIASNATAKGRAKNRRVTITVRTHHR